MKLLLDQNLPRSMLGLIRSRVPQSDHVLALDLDRATDKEIFDFAAENGFTIVSKDSDFRQLSFLHGSPPKVIWLRVGNRSTKETREILMRHADRVLAFETEPESYLVIEAPADDQIGHGET